MANALPVSPQATQSQFQNILNFRDVGATINAITGRHLVKTGRLFRSARPDSASQRDRSLLVDEYKIKTVIDLRSKTEHITAAKKHSDAAALAQSAAVPVSNDVVAAPLKITGLRYAEINLNGKGFERALLWKLSWSSLAKLMTLMTLGYRTEGIAILGREVMQPRGLTGLGVDTLDFSGEQIKEVFQVLAEESSYPVLVHCTQGKDRTGLVILLALLLCGVDIPAISDDYVMSQKELEPEMKDRLKEIQSIGLDESFAGCPSDFVAIVTNHLDSHYGGVGKYLEHIGVDSRIQHNVKGRLRDFKD